MTFFSVENSRPLGAGQHSPAGSLDADLTVTVARYKRNVASRYRTLAPNEIPTLYDQRMLVSPKIDGETWFLIIDGTTVALANPRGRVLSGPIPVLEEARRMAPRLEGGRTIFAGELFALRKDGRPRRGDLAAAVGRGEVERIGFTAFDLLDPDVVDRSLSGYDERMTRMREIFDGGKRLRVVNTEEVTKPSEVESLYNQWVASEKAEGMVVRVDGRTFKVKPVMHIDCVVVGYTLQGEDPTMLRSVLLGLVREAGQLQIIGSCGNLLTEDKRRALKERLAALDCEAAYRHASNDGALYQFVRPEVVFEIKVNDLQAEASDGEAVPRMVLQYAAADGYRATRKMPGISMLGPILSRVRDDKNADLHDAGVSQVMDRVLLADTTTHTEMLDLPESEIIRREVWVKTTKNRLAVRKLVLWKTNKETVDSRYSAYVCHWTDYSPGRKQPLQRVVRLAAAIDDAERIGDELVAEKIKGGWDQVV
jgi:hypothetical protein